MEKTCIICPKGCRLTYEEVSEQLIVTNNQCKRGPIYLKQELEQPLRQLSTTVAVSGSEIPVCPVATNQEIPKEIMFDLIKELNTITLVAPVQANQLVLAQYNNIVVDIRTTRDIDI